MGKKKERHKRRRRRPQQEIGEPAAKTRAVGLPTANGFTRFAVAFLIIFVLLWLFAPYLENRE
ncbi:MAG TPA: hypothetical protein VFV52_09940 [Bacilli bacterium]|nr:hypothetical protein [Bacilli bacterium]